MSSGGGVPGSAVAVSVFESEEEAEVQRQLQRQRERQRPQIIPAQRRGQPDSQKPFYKLHKLRVVCLSELLRHSGVTDAGRELAERFSPRNLDLAFGGLWESFSSWGKRQQRQLQQQQAGGGDQEAGASQEQEQQEEEEEADEERRASESERELRALRIDNVSPALLAVLSMVLSGGCREGGPGGETGGEEEGEEESEAGAYSLDEWWLVPESDETDGNPSFSLPSPPLHLLLSGVHERDLPAMTAACVLLARSLRDNEGLRELRLDARRVGTGSDLGPPEEASSGRGSLQQRQRQRLWGLFAEELKRSLRSNDALEYVEVALPKTSDIREEDVAEATAAAVGAKEARRRAFFMAAHPRSVEAALPVSELPMDLMVEIAKMGIRRSPCRVAIGEACIQ